MVDPVVLRAGLRSWLVEVESGGAAYALHRYLAALRDRGELPGVVDLVPGARTVLLDGDSRGVDRSHLLALLARWDGTDLDPMPGGRVVEIPVTYDGADLDEVAGLTGLSRQEIVEAHTAGELSVAFCGFSPGFAYMTGIPASLQVPRLPVPRTAVPAGAVALAEEYTGVYPRKSPGGWRIIGHTSLTIWDESLPDPALLTPGTRVRFTVEQP